MQFFMFICFIGLFLYGIELMSFFLTNFFSNKTLYFFESSENIYISFLIGILFTFITQSSSVVTAIIIAFLNANKMKFKNAFAIMLGSNIGTTFSSIFTSFNIDQYYYIILSLGLIMYFIKKTKTYSQLFLGLGFIFLSLFYLKSYLSSFFSNITYLSYFNKVNNSVLLSTLAGVFVSGIIQSSSATISLAQIATQNNYISVLSGICIILGANIGTTFTGLIAAIKSNKYAKLLAWSNFVLNVVGVLVILPFVRFFSQTSFKNLSLYLSYIHILFNVISCFVGLLLISPIINFIHKYKKRPKLT